MSRRGRWTIAHGAGVGERYSDLAKRVNPAQFARSVNITVSGDEAHASLRSSRGTPFVYFRRVDGQWRVLEKQTARSMEFFRKMVQRPGLSEEQVMLEAHIPHFGTGSFGHFLIAQSDSQEDVTSFVAFVPTLQNAVE